MTQGHFATLFLLGFHLAVHSAHFQWSFRDFSFSFALSQLTFQSYGTIVRHRLLHLIEILDTYPRLIQFIFYWTSFGSECLFTFEEITFFSTSSHQVAHTLTFATCLKHFRPPQGSLATQMPTTLVHLRHLCSLQRRPVHGSTVVLDHVFYKHQALEKNYKFVHFCLMGLLQANAVNYNAIKISKLVYGFS